MPELPEVETVRRTLEPRLAGLNITAVQILTSKIIKTPAPEQFKDIILNKRIMKINRRGKYLIIELSEKYVLLIHLRMTGRLVYTDKDAELARHTHVIFTLSNGYQLRFSDTRQFGRLWLVPSASLEELSGFKDLGVEPLGERFTRDYLKKELRRRHARIKPLLLDQTFIAGLGNIYADEALHRAKINPERLATTLTPHEIARLYHAIREVLQEGIENRGTTVRDFIDGNGRAGNFQELLRVYSKEGAPCPNCKHAIVRKKIGGRSSYFCPFCQKI